MDIVRTARRRREATGAQAVAREERRRTGGRERGRLRENREERKEQP